MRTNISPLLTSDGPQVLAEPHYLGFQNEDGDSRFDGAPVTTSFCKAIDPTSRVAALSTEQILEMNRNELIDVVRSVRATHLRPGVLERLPQMDGDMLRRLVFLTRRYCRNRQLIAEANRAPNTFAIYCG